MAQEAQTSEVAPPRQDGASVLRTLWGAAATVMAVLYTAVLAPIAALTAVLGRPGAIVPIGRWWSWLIIRTAGVKVELEGLENVENLPAFVLIANHQSMFDILALMAYFPRPVRFVAKKELLKIPFFGFALKNAGHIVVDRERGGPAVRKAVEVAKAGIPIVFFAEGHRFSDNRVHEFNAGAAWLALLTKLPCVPIAISGSAAFFPRGSMLVVPGKTMRLSLGVPIPTEGLRSTDRNQLTAQLEQAVRELFARRALPA